MARLAFGEPFDRSRQAFAARLFSLRFDDPLQVIPPLARGERLERFPGLRIFLQRCSKIWRDRQWLSLLGLGAAGRFDPRFI